MKKNYIKLLKIAGISMTSLGAVTASAIGITSCGTANAKAQSQQKPVEKTENVDVTEVIVPDGVLLDLTANDVIEVGFPNFIGEALNALLEVVFTGRVKGIEKALSNNITDTNEILDVISKEIFNDIYQIPLVVKIPTTAFVVHLGDLLLDFLDNGEEESALESILTNGLTGSLSSIVNSVTKAFTDAAGEEVGLKAANLLIEAATSLMNGGSTTELGKNIKDKLPLNTKVGTEDMSLTLTGLLDGLENKIVSNFDKITEMQGKTFEEIAENEIYINVAIHIFAMKHSAKISKEGLITSENLETMTTIYKVANGQEISKEEFIKLFSKSALIDIMTPEGILSVQTTIPNTLRDEMMNSFKLEGKTPRELMGALIGSYVDVISLSIPELQWGRGAGQLGDNEKLLATKLAQLVADHTPDIFKLFGFNLADKPKLGGIAAILGLYFIPVVDSRYTPNGIQYSGQGLTSEQTNELVKKLYAQFGISIDWKEENFVTLVNVDNLEFSEFIAYIAFQDAEGLGATRLAFALNIVNELGLKLNI